MPSGMTAWPFTQITPTELAKETGLTINQVWDRVVRSGWSLSRVRNTPLRKITAETRSQRSKREIRENATGKRRCNICRQEKLLVSSFKRSKKSSNGHFRYCKECEAHKIRAYRYGLTKIEFGALKAKQANVCAACSSTNNLHIDHDHQTGRVRGILCLHCNWALGFFHDDPKRLKCSLVWLSTPVGLPKTALGFPIRSLAKASKTRQYLIYRDHRMSPEDLDYLKIKQLCKCGICGAEKELVIDHDHKKKHRPSVRGLLCRDCNSGLGFSRDDPKILQGLIDYLGRV